MWPPLRWNSFGAPTPCWHWWARSHSCRHRALPHFSLGVAETCQIGYIHLHLPVFSKPLGVDPALSLYSYGCLSFNFRSLSGSFRYAHPLRAQIPPWRALISGPQPWKIQHDFANVHGGVSCTLYNSDVWPLSALQKSRDFHLLE